VRQLEETIRSYRVLVLALDTTTRAGSVAVTDDDRVLAVVEGDGTRTHGERLPGELQAALTAADVDLRRLDLIVVASGPGAFTGLRIGLAAIQGLAMVLDTPVVGVSALDAWAAAAWDELAVSTKTTIAAWMDALRGEVFSAVYVPRDGDADIPSGTEPSVATPEVTLPRILQAARGPVAFVGDGARRYADTIAAAQESSWTVIDRSPSLAPALARIGRRLAARGLSGPPHTLRPLYVRRPDVEIERDRQARG
jgi:tRNA threonylcarbamoyladenosine biosynthesis protein TsaB